MEAMQAIYTCEDDGSRVVLIVVPGGLAVSKRPYQLRTPDNRLVAELSEAVFPDVVSGAGRVYRLFMEC